MGASLASILCPFSVAMELEMADLEEQQPRDALLNQTTTNPPATGLGGLTVEVSEPYDASAPARFRFRGRASERDLALMSAALQAAMQPRRRGPVEASGAWFAGSCGAALCRGMLQWNVGRLSR